STLDFAGSSRLDQIRASMAGEQLAKAPERPAVESTAKEADQSAQQAAGPTDDELAKRRAAEQA
ncbi:MAG: hypothetical protein ABJA34_13835, partial [Pseudonocardiales bacterium]